MHSAAAIQLCSTPDREANHRRAEALVRQAAEQGATMALLPENWAFIGPESAKAGAAEPEDGPSFALLSQLAAETGMWIMGGTVLAASTDDDPRPTNRCTVWDDRGERRAVYDKIHLFDAAIPGGAVFQESRRIRPGTRPVVVDTPLGRMGLSVCYDLRFPWLYAELARAGATLFTVPSAFTVRTGPPHWAPLLRARAIEQLAYVLAPAQVGDHCPGRRSHGHSMVVEPFGAVVAERAVGEGIIMAEVDPERVRELRQQLPVQSHDRARSSEAVQIL